MFKKILLLLVWCISSNVHASNSWYTGKISRVWPNDGNGGFIVTFESTNSSPSSLSDCKHTYAYFLSSKISPEQLKNSLSLALSAFHTASIVGIIIDKELNGESCHASSLDIRK